MSRIAPEEDARIRSTDARRGVLADVGNGDRGLWAKMVYGKPDPFVWARPHWFGSGQRARFQIGDLVLTYRRGTPACEAIVEISSEARWQPSFAAHIPPEDFERWPWVNETVPRYLPSPSQAVTLAAIGKSGRALRNGHTRVDADMFASAASRWL